MLLRLANLLEADAKMLYKTPTIHPKLLLRLADLLEADAKKKKGIKFDMKTWGIAPWGDAEYGNRKKVGLNCGTTACAMGLAVLSKKFPGLKNVSGDSHTIVPGYKGLEGFAAAAELFGISMVDAYQLFHVDSYDNIKTWEGATGERVVAERIRHFVKEKCAS